MEDFERWLFPMRDSSRVSFGSSQLFGEQGCRKTGRFIGKGGCGRCPTGDDEVSRGETLVLYQCLEGKHVLVAIETKLDTGPGPEAAQTEWVSVQWSTKLRVGIQSVETMKDERPALRCQSRFIAGDEFLGEGQIACSQVQDGGWHVFRQKVKGTGVLSNEPGDGVCRECREWPLRRSFRLDTKEDAEGPQGFRGWKSCQLLERVAG